MLTAKTSMEAKNPSYSQLSVSQPVNQCPSSQLTPGGQKLLAMLLGGAGGIIVGVFAMAISVLEIMALEPLLKTSISEPAGLQLMAVTFVVFCAFGWLTTSVLIARYLKT